MSELPISSKYRSQPNEPVSDDERNQLSARINAAFTEGSMDAEDYQQRLDRLFAAGTLGELLPVVEGLPPAQTYDQPSMVMQSGRPGEVTQAASGTRAAMIAVGTISAAVLLIVILLVILL